MQEPGYQAGKKWTGRKKRLLALLALIALMLALFFVLRHVLRPPAQPVTPLALASIPLIEQADYPETVAVFGGENKSVASSGCGAVCMAMSIEYLTGETVSPDELFKWAHDNGHYFGDGLSHEALLDMADIHGINGAWIPNDPEPVLDALENGYPVIAHMGPGTFTYGGHYILLRGIDENGRILVNDPSSAQRTKTAYDMDLIVRELRRANSFMILKP